MPLHQETLKKNIHVHYDRNDQLGLAFHLFFYLGEELSTLIKILNATSGPGGNNISLIFQPQLVSNFREHNEDTLKIQIPGHPIQLVAFIHKDFFFLTKPIHSVQNDVTVQNQSICGVHNCLNIQQFQSLS